MTLISGYSTFVAQHPFQQVLFHDQVLFGLFAPILQPHNLTETIVEHNSVGAMTGVLTLFLFLINLVAMGLVLSLTIWQMNLITKGQTCCEEKIDKSLMNNSAQKQQHHRQPYDLGWRQNWLTFFETNSTTELMIRLLIPYSFKPKHDGTKWILNHDE
jgi:hypothetical protein